MIESEMSIPLNPTFDSTKSWVFRLPSLLACFLLAFCLLSSQLNPCDATSVSSGSSLTFILLAMGTGCLVAIDTVLNPSKNTSSNLNVTAAVTLVLFSFWLWVCTTLVPGNGNARFAINGCWQWISECVLAIAVATLCSRVRVSSSLVSLMLGCAAGTVAYSAYQVMVSMPAIRKMFAENPNVLFEKLDVVAGSAEAMQMASRIGSLEPTGPFALTNSLAGLMSTWLLFVVIQLGSKAAAAFLQNKPSKWDRASVVVFLGLVVSFFGTLLLTKSRSAWLATAVCLLLTCVVHPTLRQSGWAMASRFRSWVFGVGTLVFASIVIVLIRDPSIVAESGKSLSYRFDYWQGAWTLITAKPWTGYGVANFQQNYNRVKLATASESPVDPHNFLLETALAGGLPLLAILAAILGILIFKTIQIGLDSDLMTSPFGSESKGLDEHGWAILAGSLCGMIGMLSFECLFGDIDSILSALYFVVFSIVIGLMVHRSGWLEDDASTRVACMLSLGAMLVHLLASGGWMQPGMMNSVCLLVGLALGANQGLVVPMSMQHRKAKTGYSIAYLLLVLIGTAVFARSMCLPVLASSGIKSALSGNPNATQDASDWMEIIEVDPLDPELPSVAAKRMVEKLTQGNLSLTTKQKYCELFDTFCRQYRERDVNHWVPFAECARWNAILADMDELPNESGTGKSRVVLAYEYALKSAENFPNSAQTQLQAALFAAWCGKTEEAKRHTDRAEEIDRTTPHADRKLAAIVVFLPKKLEKSLGKMQGALPMGQPGLYQGEPIVRWLRNNVH